MTDTSTKSRKDRASRASLRVLKAPEVLADRIRQQIVSGDLREGDLLPPEAVLIERFGVSRPTIREAYRILESERLLSITRGAKGGAVVHAPNSDLIANYFLLLLQTERATITEIYEARTAFEPAVARMLAQARDKSVPPVLRQYLAVEKEAMTDPERFSEALTDFHRSLVELSGNRPLLHLYDAIYGVVVRHQTRVVADAQRRGTTEEVLAASMRGVKSQEILVDFIERGDAQGAEAHWRKHMESSGKRWTLGFENTTILELIRD
jgi:GntR family transcriptional regulator, transcriptional repressor for pyruvate dehydrogenase complex